ncbi:pentapeptide repeat-containing protein [Ensifer sp. ENS11]|uniref:pentapeptide repeat-containing protein n=1 Tax=Ensifer sp. ENS11 TaxID=2769291 RepID=UPI00046D159A|nr:pentapeptide repeat-containing protein [Ensifer sp. ENS11]MBD9492205.1 pentapeptide repeat-containing protein [Ensifer sp. ENS11]MDP9635036.1 uncharacterized protein YjbI with pentapeptide repeats [Ensifer adhaerens]
MTLEEAAQVTSVVVDVAFRDEDMTDFPFFEVRFDRCTFSNCAFDGARFGDARFTNSRFVECSFRDAKLQSCTFYDPDLDSGSNWQRCDLSHATFRKCNLRANAITNTKAFLLSLAECDASASTLHLEVQRRVAASRSVTGGIICARTKLYEAVLKERDWEGSRFEYCDLRGADFRDGNFFGVSFANSNLNNARFDRANLSEANIAHADIDGLDLTLMRSFDGITVSRAQHDQILANFNIRSAN